MQKKLTSAVKYWLAQKLFHQFFICAHRLDRPCRSSVSILFLVVATFSFWLWRVDQWTFEWFKAAQTWANRTDSALRFGARPICTTNWKSSTSFGFGCGGISANGHLNCLILLRLFPGLKAARPVFVFFPRLAANWLGAKLRLCKGKITEILYKLFWI